MYELSKVSDISILHLYGEVTLLEVELLQKVIDSLKRHHHNNILIDLLRVDHLHLKAINRWTQEAHELRQKNGDLKLVTQSNDTKNMMVFTGADQSLEDYSSMSEAILSFLNKAQDETELDKMYRVRMNQARGISMLDEEQEFKDESFH